MNTYVMKQHLSRAWRRHWPLQVASVTVMSAVLLILNLLFLAFSAFNQTVAQWSHGLEMIVYLKDGAGEDALMNLRRSVESSGDFGEVRFVSKTDATGKFLQALGPESLELMKDPQWKSPIPASFELRLSDRVPMEMRLASLEGWSARLKGLEWVEDVFYGQGWIENFSRFLRSVRGVVALTWLLSFGIGLLIVGNCIRLSFLQRRDEIAVLELVGATARFIRAPFLLEGLVLGVLASLVSLAVSFGLHSFLLLWLSQKWTFWVAFQQIPPLRGWYVLANLVTGAFFGVLGAWNCVRKLNTGWSAAG
jgi:cell division transport system permease protein